MSKLEKQLNNWVSNNFVTNEQAKKIRAFEEAKPSHSWVLYGFLILGVVVISIGIISLIAANWQEIPDALKLIVDFILLIALAAGAYSSWENKREILFEVLLVSLMFFCLASIGLISQIYHTGGKLYQALFVWSVITSGAAAASKHSFTPYVWVTGFLSSIIFIALDNPALRPLFNYQKPAVFMAIPLLSAVLAILCRKVSGDSGQTKAFRAWAVTGGLIALILAEAQIWWYDSLSFKFVAFLPGYIFAALSAIGILISFEYKKAQKILLLVTLGLYLVPFHLPAWGVESSVEYAIFTVAILATMAVFLASLKLRRLFQFFLIALGLRFLVLYFQALGGLATTGFGLIFSGIVIIAMVILWNKYRREITTWAEGIVS